MDSATHRREGTRGSGVSAASGGFPNTSVVLAAMAGLEFLLAVHKVLLLLLVAGFLAVVLNPVVDAVQRPSSSRLAVSDS